MQFDNGAVLKNGVGGGALVVGMFLTWKKKKKRVEIVTVDQSVLQLFCYKSRICARLLNICAKLLKIIIVAHAAFRSCLICRHSFTSVVP